MNRRRAASLLVILSSFLGGILGCAPTTPTTAPASTSGQSNLVGQIAAASDVAGSADTPLAQQLIIVIPADQAASALGLGAQPIANQRLRFQKAQLTDRSLPTSISDNQGRYGFTLPPGAYIICVADSDQLPPTLPATTRGCGQVDIPTNGTRRVDISSGFGEILLIER